MQRPAEAGLGLGRRVRRGRQCHNCSGHRELGIPVNLDHHNCFVAPFIRIFLDNAERVDLLVRTPVMSYFAWIYSAKRATCFNAQVRWI